MNRDAPRPDLPGEKCCDAFAHGGRGRGFSKGRSRHVIDVFSENPAQTYTACEVKERAQKPRIGGFGCRFIANKVESISQ
jgi:hypothetical protein